MLNKRGKIEVGLVILILLILVMIILQVQGVKTLSYEEEMNLKYNVKSPQLANWTVVKERLIVMRFAIIKKKREIIGI